MRDLAANASVIRGDWSVSASANLRQREDFDLDKPSFEIEGVAGDKTNLDLRLGHTINAHTQLFFAPRYYHEDIYRNMAPVFTPGVGNINTVKREEAERFHATLGGRTSLGTEQPDTYLAASRSLAG